MYVYHKQVLFDTLDGKTVSVDEGIRDILTELKKLGVRTEYTCQGDDFSAYVSADAKSFGRVIRKMKRYHRKGWYSELSMDLTDQLFMHRTEIYLNHNLRHEFRYRIFRPIQSWYKVERSISQQFGHRLTVRWHKQSNDDMLQLLRETSQLLHG